MLEMSRAQDQTNVLNKNHQMSTTQMSLSHSVQSHNNQKNPLNSITDYLEKINTVKQQFSSFELAEKAINQLVVELEKSMIQETLNQYDINTPIIELGGEIYHRA